jgi:hypothetical protein
MTDQDILDQFIKILEEACETDEPCHTLELGYSSFIDDYFDTQVLVNGLRQLIERVGF